MVYSVSSTLKDLTLLSAYFLIGVTFPGRHAFINAGKRGCSCFRDDSSRSGSHFLPILSSFTRQRQFFTQIGDESEYLRPMQLERHPRCTFSRQGYVH